MTGETNILEASAEAEASGTAPETHTWTVLRRDERDPVTYGFDGPTWTDLGSIESQSEWSLYPADDEALGERFGAGEYLCIHGQRCERVTIAADTVYRRVETDGE